MDSQSKFFLGLLIISTLMMIILMLTSCASVGPNVQKLTFFQPPVLVIPNQVYPDPTNYTTRR